MEADLQTASASSSSPSPSATSSTAMVRPAPPGPIKKTMTKQDVVDNLLLFDKSDPDENSRLSKTDELVAWLSKTTEGNGGLHNSASGLIRNLPMLIETSRADSDAVHKQIEIEYIHCVQEKIDGGNSNYELHDLLFSKLGVVDKRRRYKGRVPQTSVSPRQVREVLIVQGPV